MGREGLKVFNIQSISYEIIIVIFKAAETFSNTTMKTKCIIWSKLVVKANECHYLHLMCQL